MQPVESIVVLITFLLLTAPLQAEDKCSVDDTVGTLSCVNIVFVSGHLVNALNVSS